MHIPINLYDQKDNSVHNTMYTNQSYYIDYNNIHHSRIYNELTYASKLVYDNKLSKLEELSIDEINQIDIYGNNSLHMACMLHNETAVDILIRLGASINSKNMDSITPLHMASGFTYNKTVSVPIMKMLLDANADINSQNKWGWSALHIVAYDSYLHNDICTVKLLLDRSANINLITGSGFTPLYLYSLSANFIEQQSDDINCDNFPDNDMLGLLVANGASAITSPSFYQPKILQFLVNKKQSKIKKATS